MKTKNKGKTILYIFGGIVLSFFILMIPFLSSHTEVGKRAVISLIQKETGYTVHIGKLHLSWLKQQEAHDIEIREQDGFRCFAADTICLRGSLLRLLLYKKPKGISVSSWELQWRNPKQERLQDTAPIFNPYLNILSRIKDANLLSENGSIKLYTYDDTVDASLSHLYMKKTRNHLAITGITTSKQKIGSIAIKGSLRKRFHIDADIRSFPTLLFYPLLTSSFSRQILDLEEFVDVQAQAYPQSQRLILDVSSKSKNIDFSLQGYIQNKQFYIPEGSAAIIRCQPALASMIFGHLTPISSKITMQPVQVNLSSAQVPLDIHQWQQSELTGIVTLPQVAFTSPNTSVAVQLNQIEVALNKSSKLIQITSSASANLGGRTESYINGQINIDPRKKEAKFLWKHSHIPHTYLRELFPGPFFINIPLDVPYYSLSIDGNYRRSQFSANILVDNPLLQISCQAKGPLRSLKFQGQSSYYFPQKVQQKLATYCSHVEGQFSGKMNYSNKHIYFPKFYGKVSCGKNEIFVHGKAGKANKIMAYETSSLLVYGKLGFLPLTLFHPNLSDLVLNKASFSLHSDGNKSLLKGNTQILISNPTNKDAPDTRILIPEFLISTLDSDQPLSLKNISLRTSGEILDFPTDYLLKIQGKETRISNFIGPLGNAVFSLNYHPLEEDPVIAKITTKTDATQGDLLLMMDSEFQLTDKTKGSLQWEVTPERYMSLFDQTSCTPSCLLYRTANLRLNISKLFCEENKKGAPCLAALLESGVEGHLSSNPLVFYDYAMRETFIINELSGELSSNNFDRELNYEFRGECIAQKQEIPLSTFVIKGTASNLLTAPKRSFSQSAEWKEIPTNFVGGIFPFSTDVKTKLLSLAGPQINVNIDNHFTAGQGPITIRIRSSNLQAHFPLILTDKAILLEHDLTAELKINEEINQAFFREINPLISSSAYSEHPVFLQVNKENFYLPIWPYSFEDFTVQSAFLDFGKIFIKNSSTLYDIFQFLDIEEDKPFVEAWFTPVFFSIHKGILEYKRFDALLDHRIRLALWGKTDIIKQRLNTNLGIDPEVIKKHFHNTSLKTKNFFIIKIRGPISSPEVDWSSAYARIALLKSYSLVSPFSSFADRLFSSLGDTTPPQTTSPLPWEQEMKKHRNDH